MSSIPLTLNPINIVSTDFYTCKYKIPFDHPPSIEVLTGTVTSYTELMEASPMNYKSLIGNISAFLNDTSQSPEYFMYDREALKFLGGHDILYKIFGERLWEMFGEPDSSTQICHADPLLFIIKYIRSPLLVSLLITDHGISLSAIVLFYLSDQWNDR